MNSTIALVSQFTPEEERRWLTALNARMSDFNLLPFSKISPDELLKLRVAIVANPSERQISQLTSLKWVQSLWAGVEQLVEQLEDRQIKIVPMNDPNLANDMANSVLLWCLHLQQNTPIYQRQQSQMIWQPHSNKAVKETRIGILGLGKLGQHSAIRLKEQGFKVSGWSRSAKNIQGVHCYFGNDRLEEFISNTDILVSLLPLTKETENLLDTQRLSWLPVGSSVINFSRGAILDEAALISALDKNSISHAVLDVFRKEPLPASHALWRHSQVTILPHIAAATNINSASKIAANNIIEYFQNDTIPASVNFQKGY